jgi:hypothetical protein
MKAILLFITLTGSTALCFGQANLISYEDMKYLLHNNLEHADTFLMSKGYALKSKNEKKKTREYTLSIKGGTHVDLTLRADGKRLFMDLETNEVGQYNLINNSISQYINKSGSTPEVQTYTVKDLCSIYITVNDAMPYDPLKRDYDMQIVADKNVTAYN